MNIGILNAISYIVSFICFACSFTFIALWREKHITDECIRPKENSFLIDYLFILLLYCSALLGLLIVSINNNEMFFILFFIFPVPFNIFFIASSCYIVYKSDNFVIKKTLFRKIIIDLSMDDSYVMFIDGFFPNPAKKSVYITSIQQKKEIIITPFLVDGDWYSLYTMCKKIVERRDKTLST